MSFDEILRLRARIDRINTDLLRLLSERADTVRQIGEIKLRDDVERFDPMREAEQLDAIVAKNRGPFGNATVRHLFTQIFRASLDLMEKQEGAVLRVSRRQGQPDTVFEVRGAAFGGPDPVVIAGPCSVETDEQVRRTAAHLAGLGLRVLRGGALKPRTSPYAFQGLERKGYEILVRAAAEFGLATVSEVVDAASVEWAEGIDILQIGARNMSNFKLLEAVARTGKPVLLKRGLAATYEEFILAAEYLAACTELIALCERGIRTFEPWTRNTLDISAVPILRMRTHLPVIVDVSHAAGRTDILAPLARAALAAGANGLMVEVHPATAFARSDPAQQLDFGGLTAFLRDVFGAAGAGRREEATP